MNLRNLAIMTITIALGTLSASAQQREGSVTFTDHSNQSVTISRFGTVLGFKNSYGKESMPDNIYRICLCGKKTPCIETATIPSEQTSSKLEVEFPRKGIKLKKGQTLVVTAMFRQAEITVERRLEWKAGSSSVKIDEIISASKPLCLCTFEEEEKEDKPVARMTMKMCAGPPGWICPPRTSSAGHLKERIPQDDLTLRLFSILLDFSK